MARNDVRTECTVFLLKRFKLLRGHFSDRNVNIFVGTTPKEIPIRLDQ